MIWSGEERKRERRARGSSPRCPRRREGLGRWSATVNGVRWRRSWTAATLGQGSRNRGDATR
uniref:Uncharacterized protein n=1 Tax=Arundo donax TaxID=35708 RepID=A0A0A9BY18_ARUDO